MSETEQLKLLDLYAYQKRWLEDRSRFKIGLWPRQCGKSFAVATEVVLDALEHKTLWVILSRGERQSKEAMQKVAMLARALGHVVDEMEDTFRGDDGDYALLEVRLPNGSRVLGLPANPDTARGFSGNVVLDEFGFHADSKAIWTALFPTISRGFSIRVVSTPNGKKNKFYELWTSAEDEGWSKHALDIYQAVEQGCPQDPEELRKGLGDALDWAQEYECKFIDEATAFLPLELIYQCEDDLTSMDGVGIGEGDLFLGVDIGRHRDLTVFWLLELVDLVYWTREVVRLQGVKFAEQRRLLYVRLDRPRLRRACIDATGLGMQLAEEARDRYGSKVEPVTFTAAAKQEIATTLRPSFEDRTTRIPVDDGIRKDLHSVQRVVTAAGNIRYDADRSEAGGTHADHFWALGLARHAADNPPGPIEYESLQPRRFSQADDGRMAMRPRPMADAHGRFGQGAW